MFDNEDPPVCSRCLAKNTNGLLRYSKITSDMAFDNLN
jgi:hypothetical protein